MVTLRKKKKKKLCKKHRFAQKLIENSFEIKFFILFFTFLERNMICCDMDTVSSLVVLFTETSKEVKKE